MGIEPTSEACEASPSAFGPHSWSLRRLLPAPSPCCQRDSPDVISANLSAGAWSLPRRPQRVHLPVSSSVSSAFPRHSLG